MSTNNNSIDFWEEYKKNFKAEINDEFKYFYQNWLNSNNSKINLTDLLIKKIFTCKKYELNKLFETKFHPRDERDIKCLIFELQQIFNDEITVIIRNINEERITFTGTKSKKQLLSSRVDSLIKIRDKIKNIFCQPKFMTEFKTELFSRIIFTNDLREKTRKSISSPLKVLVWDRYIGLDIGKAKCYCCKTIDILQTAFNCGHVISQFEGGTLEVENLRPICQNCNSSMGTENMEEFMKTLK